MYRIKYFLSRNTNYLLEPECFLILDPLNFVDICYTFFETFFDIIVLEWVIFTCKPTSRFTIILQNYTPTFSSMFHEQWIQHWSALNGDCKRRVIVLPSNIFKSRIYFGRLSCNKRITIRSASITRRPWKFKKLWIKREWINFALESKLRTIGRLTGEVRPSSCHLHITHTPKICSRLD